MLKCFLFFLFFTFNFHTQSMANICNAWIAQVNQRNEILELTESAMKKAGDQILDLKKKDNFNFFQKTHFADIKTAGDCLSQEIILNQLASHEVTKNANFIAEEKCAATNDLIEKNSVKNDATWILDPIDGTTNYANGLPHFGISLALVVKNEVCFAAIYAPVLKEFFYAFKGKGAFSKQESDQSFEKISVSKADKLELSLWITGTEAGPKPEAIQKNEKTFSITLQLLPKTQDMRRLGSASLDLAYVASGRAQGYFELSEGLNWWDIAAGILLVSEAGGRVSVLEPNLGINQNTVHLERPILYVLATNGHPVIHTEFEKQLNNGRGLGQEAK